MRYLAGNNGLISSILVLGTLLFSINILSGCASSSGKIEDNPYYFDVPESDISHPSVIGIVKEETCYEAYDQGRLDRNPKIRYYIKPSYPYLARAAGIEGAAVLEVIVDRNGNVENATILDSRITPSMEQALLDAAEKFTYQPGRRRHRAIKCWVRHLVVFALNGDAVQIDVK